MSNWIGIEYQAFWFVPLLCVNCAATITSQRRIRNRISGVLVCPTPVPIARQPSHPIAGFGIEFQTRTARHTHTLTQTDSHPARRAQQDRTHTARLTHIQTRRARQTHTHTHTEPDSDPAERAQQDKHAHSQTVWLCVCVVLGAFCCARLAVCESGCVCVVGRVCLGVCVLLEPYDSPVGLL